MTGCPPKPAWFDCSSIFGTPGAECATVQLPLDYDKPKGAKTGVAVLRLKATDRKHKIGSLFLNPGGPGGSGVGIASAAPFFLSPDLLARFDIVGFDPRVDQLQRQRALLEQRRSTGKRVDGTQHPLPVDGAGGTRIREVVPAVRQGLLDHGAGRSTASMSTAEVARDMDVLRRAVGD